MSTTSEPAATWLDLYDWRRRVAGLYQARDAALRAGERPAVAWRQFRAGKDGLFAAHPQSPLSSVARQDFGALPYFLYDPALAVAAVLAPEAEPEDAGLAAGGPSALRFQRAARLRFTLGGTEQSLFVYWIDVYGGGLFCPFRDATSGLETYGGGRYLIDTVKGSDFFALDPPAARPGYAGGRVLLDFNYAYNPSCAYDARWICPLAPPENRLSLPVRAGEQHREHLSTAQPTTTEEPPA